MHGALTKKRFFFFYHFLFFWLCMWIMFSSRIQCCERLTRFWYKVKKLSEESTTGKVLKSDSDNFTKEPREHKNR